MTTQWYFYLVPALATLLIGFFAGYNGLQSNRIAAQHNKFEENSERLEQASKLMNDALNLVDSLRKELTKTQTENEKLRGIVESLRVEFTKTQEENEKLRETVESLTLRVAELEKLNVSLKNQVKGRQSTAKHAQSTDSDCN